MKVKCQKQFANGVVYALELKDGLPIEVTDTFLPYYTKDITNSGTNKLHNKSLGDRNERWMIGVSTMSGCPVGCKFCATGQLKKYRNLTWQEIVYQVVFIRESHHEFRGKEMKINYTRMGEPFLNIDAVREAIKWIDDLYPNDKFHHYVSTVGLRGSDFSWIKGNISLQVSLHSLDEDRRHDLIPINNLMSIKELGQIRTQSNLKTTVNLTLVDHADFDISVLSEYFDPEHFFIKLSPINENEVSKSNDMGAGIIKQTNIL